MHGHYGHMTSTRWMSYTRKFLRELEETATKMELTTSNAAKGCVDEANAQAARGSEVVSSPRIRMHNSSESIAPTSPSGPRIRRLVDYKKDARLIQQHIATGPHLSTRKVHKRLTLRERRNINTTLRKARSSPRSVHTRPSSSPRIQYILRNFQKIRRLRIAMESANLLPRHQYLEAKRKKSKARGRWQRKRVVESKKSDLWDAIRASSQPSAAGGVSDALSSREREDLLRDVEAFVTGYKPF